MKTKLSIFLLGITLFGVFAIGHAETNHYPWLTRVYDYNPAPGQFINTLPAYEAGEPKDSVIDRCRQNICGHIDTIVTTFHGETHTRIDTVWSESMISLGGYGGSVIVGFDHPVVNQHTYDFEILGNAFVAARESKGGSCEPGIVMVSRDVNGNGLPDDPWYELAGSEYHKPKTQHNYEITYYRPDENKTPEGSGYLNDTTYIRWTSNDCLNPDSTSGYMAKNVFHSQSYWPQWETGETLTFKGTKLPCNAVDLGNNGGNSYFVQYFFDWGYVDNLPNEPTHASAGDDYNNEHLYNPGFKLDWAVDQNGNPVYLPQIDFIKIYTAENQYCGWLGETSTEVAGGIDFHPEATVVEVRGDVNGDGSLDVSDVTCLTNIILHNSTAPYNPFEADANGDGITNVSDVTELINLILGN